MNFTDRYTCIVCKEIFRVPCIINLMNNKDKEIHSKCIFTNRICKDCFNRKYKAKTSKNCLWCKQQFHGEISYSKDSDTMNIMNDLRKIDQLPVFTCDLMNNDAKCNDIFETQQELDNHMCFSCNFSKASCKYSDRGCRYRCLRKDIISHEEKCNLRTLLNVKCPMCNLNFMQNEIDNHIKDCLNMRNNYVLTDKGLFKVNLERAKLDTPPGGIKHEDFYNIIKGLNEIVVEE